MMGEHYGRVSGTRELIGPYDTAEELERELEASHLEAIADADARELVELFAPEWHGGQWSGLYAIASAGIDAQHGATLAMAGRELHEAADIHVGPSNPILRDRLRTAAEYLERLSDELLEEEGY